MFKYTKPSKVIFLKCHLLISPVILDELVGTVEDLHNKYTKSAKKMSLHISKDQEPPCNKKNTNQRAYSSEILHISGD